MPSLTPAPKKKRGRPKTVRVAAVAFDDQYRLTRESQSLLAMSLNQFWEKRGLQANARIEKLGSAREGCVQEWVVRSDIGKFLRERVSK